MWQDIATPIKRYAGASGTLTVPVGAKVLAMTVHATTAGSVTFWDQVGGTVTVPIPANTWWIYSPLHLNTTATNTGNQTITFTGTDSYFAEITSGVGF